MNFKINFNFIEINIFLNFVQKLNINIIILDKFIFQIRMFKN